MRKYSKFIIVAGALAALVAPSAAMANASQHLQTGSGTNAGTTETGWIGSQQGGSNNTTQQFSSTYTDPVFGGPITCTGVHQVNKKNGVQDSFTCKLSGLDANGNPAAWASTPYIGQTVSWNSDFYGVAAADGVPIHGQTQPGSMTITGLGHDANGAVTSYTGLATYPGATA